MNWSRLHKTLRAPFTPPPGTSLWRSFLGIYLPLLALLLGVGVLHYRTNEAAEQSSRNARESLNVGLARRMLQTDIGAVVSDLGFLAEHLERQGLYELTPSETYYDRTPENEKARVEPRRKWPKASRRASWNRMLLAQPRPAPRTSP